MKWCWLWLLVVSGLAQAGMNKCRVDGAVVYQDQPCSSAQQTLQTGVADRAAATGSADPLEIQLPPQMPSEALYRELIGSWCEDPAAFYELIRAIYNQASKRSADVPASDEYRLSYKEKLAQLKKTDPKAYAEAMNAPPRLVVTFLPDHVARSSGRPQLLPVRMDKEGFVVGDDGLTIYRHGQHFYRGSHEFHRVPLMRCTASP
ncbi:hypothetical protein SAMN02745857_01889 [Andreprevotia lacus DSM 23236]|jgi:hypothetical protein|uniref:DUF4124 domain-containing protein n=1 Tax=Andreprevotia lacus DSM 23236 TaxID=1121001 RepID=A0A1W1XKQ1_9NEIS|nr:DUF4124 domain-containing protein [Andreprevotia lacus]SMC24387.1 hypothetical protein SAMN02745857_01889 [Andreprevotia lacus DSM 23236]